VSYAAANSSDFKQRLKLLKVFADLVDVPRQFQTSDGSYQSWAVSRLLSFRPNIYLVAREQTNYLTIEKELFFLTYGWHRFR